MNGARALEAPRRATAIAVAVLTLAAAGLRLPTVGRSLWLDEAWRANIALAPTWQEFWSRELGSGNGIGAPMPPLFALALRAIGSVVGHSAAGMRAFPVAASIAAVPLAYVVGHRAAGRWAGLAAALCFTASPTALLHGQELKQYSTDIALVLLLLAATSRVALAPSSRRAWIVLALAMGLAPGLAYPAALALPGIALATLACCRTRVDRARWLVATAASALAALAWYVEVIGPQRARPLVAAYWAQDFPPLDGVPSAGWVATQLLDFLRYCSLAPAWLAACLLLVGLLLAARWLGIAAIASVATLVGAAAWRLYPLAGGRTTIFLLPFVYVALAAVVGAAARRDLGAPIRFGVAVVAACVVVPMLTYGLRAPAAGIVYEETAPLITILETARRPQDRVYVYDGAVAAFRFRHPTLDPAITLGGSHRRDQAAYAAELRPLLVPGTRLWLLFSHVFTPASGRPERDTILSDLTLYARQLEVHEARGGASLHLFEVTRAPDTVRYLRLTPGDLADPARMKELLGR